MTIQTWQTDEPCQECGRGLYVSENPDQAQVSWDCRTCGWSIGWQVEADLSQVADRQPADQCDQNSPPGTVPAAAGLGVGGADVNGLHGVESP
jgi:hypothetical protein